MDYLISRAVRWRQEMGKLREIALGCGLTEELKWGKPGYTFQRSNVVIIVGFKDYCALLFPKGALLKDPKGILVTAGENTQAARQARFTSCRQIDELKGTLKSYVQEAIDAEKAGLKVRFKTISEFKLPEELETRLNATAGLKTAFSTLTPGRQRGYIMYISSAKQATTREARVEKCVPRILDGKGLDD
jgi:uncharacterized protein YdeI (YjbR/CyaY-like superfamily)